MSKSVKASIKKARRALKAEDYPTALALFTEAGADFEALENPEAGLEAVYFEWAHAFYKAGQSGEALKKISLFLENLTEFPTDLQDKLQYLLAQCHYDHAQFIQEEKPEKAHNHYHKALGYHGLSRIQRAHAFYKQGIVLTRLKEFRPALHSFNNALDMYTKLQESFWIGMTRLKIGMLALLQKQIEPAKEQALQVISDLEGNTQTGEHAVLKTAYDLMSELCLHQKDTEGFEHWKQRSETL